MLRSTLIVLAVLALVGCDSGGESPSAAPASGRMQAAGPTDTQRAAYAASVHFPNDLRATTDIPISALVQPSQTTIRLFNYSTRPLRDVQVWINQAFVTHIDGIPARGSVTLHTADFYNALGTSLFTQRQEIHQVQIRTSEGLINVLGPLSE